jgi:hypothetical protein
VPQAPPDIVDPAVNDDRQQQFKVQPECEVAVCPLGAKIVHNCRLVQLCFQLVAQISRHCKETRTYVSPGPGRVKNPEVCRRSSTAINTITDLCSSSMEGQENQRLGTLIEARAPTSSRKAATATGHTLVRKKPAGSTLLGGLGKGLTCLKGGL